MTAVLEAEDLAAGYGDVIALHGVSLTVAPNSITVLLGSNGAGKSTFLRTIAGLLPTRRGHIVFSGQDITSCRSDQRVDLGIVMVPEGRLIFPQLTVEENLKLGAFSPRARTRQAEGLDQAYVMFPRLKERRSQMGGTLSGGEQQMLALARGLMARPQLLLLDEPTLGLAPVMATMIFETIKQLKASGLTILLAEQDVRRTLEIADQGYVLESGKLAMSGSGAELIADQRIGSAYLGI
ncbi:MAG: ABC transporter ATP-binding protein [Xanthobacteraceae bacterium]|nr:MAG: ABC transporter ATP-binding protein [Xanthobacteraceae bacterium]